MVNPHLDLHDPVCCMRVCFLTLLTFACLYPKATGVLFYKHNMETSYNDIIVLPLTGFLIYKSEVTTVSLTSVTYICNRTILRTTHRT